MHVKCDDCEAMQRPKAKRPAAVPRTCRFNRVVGVDLVVVKNHEEKPQFWLNIICWGTLYQQCVEVPDKKASTIAQTFLDFWIRYFGPPLTTVIDQGTEFLAEPLKDLCDRKLRSAPSLVVYQRADELAAHLAAKLAARRAG